MRRNPLDGNPVVHCPQFEWEISGAQLLEEGELRKDLPGVDMLVAFEHLSEQPMPRDVSGTVRVDPTNGRHGHRPVYFFARQVDDAKVWTSAMLIAFTD